MKQVEVLQMDYRTNEFHDLKLKKRVKGEKLLILEKKSQVLITVENGPARPVYDMESEICDFYHKRRMSQKLFNQFCRDVWDEKVKLYLDNENLVIK